MLGRPNRAKSSDCTETSSVPAPTIQAGDATQGSRNPVAPSLTAGNRTADPGVSSSLESRSRMFGRRGPGPPAPHLLSTAYLRGQPSVRSL